MALILAKKTRNPPTTGVGKTYTNGESRKNICNNGTPKSIGNVYTIQPIYYGSRQENLDIWLGIVKTEWETELGRVEDRNTGMRTRNRII